MKYDQIQLLDNKRFRRLTGVKRATFNKMLDILRDANQKLKGDAKIN